MAEAMTTLQFLKSSLVRSGREFIFGISKKDIVDAIDTVSAFLNEEERLEDDCR